MRRRDWWEALDETTPVRLDDDLLTDTEKKAFSEGWVRRGLAIGELMLEQTCDACPESYDAYDERGVRVARLRLRHGAFRAELEDGTVVFRSRPRGDGMFEADERMPQLRAAASAIASARRGQ